MRLKITIMSALLSTLAVGWIWFEGRSPAISGDMVRMEIVSPSGVRLASFFDGLPVDSRFVAGEIIAPDRRGCGSSQRKSKLSAWMKTLWGVAVVHAQSGCTCNFIVMSGPCGGSCTGSVGFPEPPAGSACSGYKYVGCATSCTISGQQCTGIACYSSCSCPTGGGGGCCGCDPWLC
jgi:hypothetical protein